MHIIDASEYPLRELALRLAEARTDNREPRVRHVLDSIGSQLIGSYATCPAKLALIKAPSQTLMDGAKAVCAAAGITVDVTRPDGTTYTIYPTHYTCDSALYAHGLVTAAMRRAR